MALRPPSHRPAAAAPAAPLHQAGRGCGPAGDGTIIRPESLLLDTHAHLEDQAFAGDLEAVLERARGSGVLALVTAGTDLATSLAAVTLAERHEEVYAAVGFHPHHAAELTTQALAVLRELAGHPKVVAIGEIGLDFYRDWAPRSAQETAFRQQLELAGEIGLPIVVHCREAERETEALLIPWAEALPQPVEQPRGLLHCFSGDLALAHRYRARNFLISLAGPISYPKNAELRTVARYLPLTSLTVETDAPYLPPQPYRGRRNEPAYLWDTVAALAAVRGEDPLAVAQATTANALHLFRLPVAAPLSP